MNSCRICGEVKFAEKCAKEFAGCRSMWVECIGCHVQRIYPYPTSEELTRYYNDRYLSKQCSGAVSHLKRFSPTYRPTVFHEYSLTFSDVGVRIEDLKEARVLDYGCADGIFLDWLTSLGANKQNLFGIDLSAEMVECAVKKGYRACTPDQQDDLLTHPFDFICLWDVLEHISNPRETIAELTEVMRPGTYVLIQTPMLGLLSERLGEQFEHYLPIEHLHLFPRHALLELFESAGFSHVNSKSFGANAPTEIVPHPYKQAYDSLAKLTDNGATQVALFQWEGGLP